MSPQAFAWAARLESEDEGQGEVEAGPKEVGRGERVRLSRDISDFCPAVSSWVSDAYGDMGAVQEEGSRGGAF